MFRRPAGKLIVGPLFAFAGKLIVDVVANRDHHVAVADAFDRDEHDRLVAVRKLGVGRQRRPDRARRRIDRRELMARARRRDRMRRINRPDRQMSRMRRFARQTLVRMAAAARQTLVRSRGSPLARRSMTGMKPAAREPLIGVTPFDLVLNGDDRPIALAWHGSS
jgi:hypothetical protein